MTVLRKSSILVTGAVGTVGAELIKQLLSNDLFEVHRIIALDNDESGLFFRAEQYSRDSRVHFFVTDIRDRDALIKHMKDIDFVFHAAALKHVMLSENSPDQVLQTNAIGVQNIIHAAQINNVRKVIFTSSDKAVNPTNVMGASKLLGERLITAANNNSHNGHTIFSSTRFGNVLGSNGSVVPIFERQIASGGPVTLTHTKMSRFVMSIEEAVSLVINSVEIALGGEVFVTKMPAIMISDLAQALIEIIAPIHGYNPKNIEITNIGVKPGEKLHEELMNTEEVRRAVELDKFFSVLPPFSNSSKSAEYQYENVENTIIEQPFTSQNQSHLSINEIKKLIKRYGLFQDVLL